MAFIPLGFGNFIQGRVEMNNSIFDLEQQIMECWNVTNDVGTVTKWFVDDPAWEGMDPKLSDAIMNKYFAIQELYELKFDKMWHTFEKVCTAFNEMAFSIDKVTVTAKSRALKADYSLELAQDLKAVHNLDAEAELSNILAAEILAERGSAGTASAGTFDLDVDANGRWSVEKFKGLMFHIEREANLVIDAINEQLQLLSEADERLETLNKHFGDR